MARWIPTTTPKRPTITAKRSERPTSFQNFPRLPPELRCQIWHAALPESIGPAIYFYKYGRWTAQPFLLQGAKDSLKELEPVVFNIHVAYASRESHSVVRAWLRSQRSATVDAVQKLGDEFFRPYNPKVPVLFLQNLKEGNSIQNCTGGRFDDTDIKRVAIHEAELAVGDNVFSRLLQAYPLIKVIYIVLGPCNPGVVADNSPPMGAPGWWCQIGPIQGGTFSWNAVDSVAFETNVRNGEQCLQRRIHSTSDDEDATAEGTNLYDRIARGLKYMELRYGHTNGYNHRYDGSDGYFGYGHDYNGYDEPEQKSVELEIQPVSLIQHMN